MPPPKAPTKKHGAKRKNTPPSTPAAKRSKLDATPKSTPKRSGRTLGPVVDLSKDNMPPDESLLVQGSAVRLFQGLLVRVIFTRSNFQTLKQFRYASLVFWITFSIEQRGASPDVRQRLLDAVAKTTNHVDDGWTEPGSMHWHLWNEEHNFVVQHYQDTFHKYMQKWLDSPAGKKYDALIRKARYDFE